MTLVFLLEEPSMAAFLEGLLPRILPEGIEFLLVPHKGKSDLEASIPRKLRAWRTPDTRFIVVRDQDLADCKVVKAGLRALCTRAVRPDTLVRVACRELEAWLLGDLIAVGQALDTPALVALQRKKFRQPDLLSDPSALLAELTPGHGKTSRARAVRVFIDEHRCRSTSFQHFLNGVRRLIGEGADRGPS